MNCDNITSLLMIMWRSYCYHLVRYLTWTKLNTTNIEYYCIKDIYIYWTGVRMCDRLVVTIKCRKYIESVGDDELVSWKLWSVQPLRFRCVLSLRLKIILLSRHSRGYFWKCHKSSTSYFIWVSIILSLSHEEVIQLISCLFWPCCSLWRNCKQTKIIIMLLLWVKLKDG